MANCVVVSFADGSMLVEYPIACTAEVCASRAEQSPGFVAYKIMDTSLLPMRVYRAAWRLVGGVCLEVDMELAKEIQRNLWRAARAPLLVALDVNWIKAQEANDTVAMLAIGTAKEELRNVTLIDLSGITTPEELYTVWPAALGSR